jgi:hypothetical protein
MDIEKNGAKNKKHEGEGDDIAPVNGAHCRRRHLRKFPEKCQ